MAKFNFPNCGFIQFKLNESQLWQVKQNISEIQNDFSKATAWNEHLAGNLQREYKLSDDTSLDLDKHLYPYVNEYINEFGHINELNSVIENPKLKLGVTWVNFQAKGEFNPMHNHDGVLSFALWIKIPYNIKNEIENSSSRYSNTAVPGHFQFAYSSCIGEHSVYSIPADEMMEGYGVLFSSKLLHTVYPFYTSDDYRISVSGNYYYYGE